MDSGNGERFLTRATLGQHALGDGADIGGAVHDGGAGGGQRLLLRLSGAGGTADDIAALGLRWGEYGIGHSQLMLEHPPHGLNAA